MNYKVSENTAAIYETYRKASEAFDAADRLLTKSGLKEQDQSDLSEELADAFELFRVVIRTMLEEQVFYTLLERDCYDEDPFEI